MKRLADLYIIYQLVRRLTTPFDKTKAYELGIIDADGNVLRPLKTLRTNEERSAWTWLDILLNNIKRFMVRLPGGRSRWFTYFMALYLLREPVKKLRESASKTHTELWTEITQSPGMSSYLNESLALVEDAPAVNVGSGTIAGLGVGPQGEPGVVLPRTRTFGGCRVVRVGDRKFRQCEARVARKTQTALRESVIRHVSDIPHSGVIVVNITDGAVLFLPTPRRS